MTLTEKMLVLKCLFDHGDCTLRQVADALEIPEGRAYAHIAALVREQDAHRQRHGDAWAYTPTEAGEEKVKSWLLVYRMPLRMADDG